MAKLIIGTTPVQIAPTNPRRIGWELQFIPSSVIAGNTGLVFVSRDKIPTASTAGENNENILVAAAAIERKLENGDSKDEVQGAIWGIADTASQQCTFKEFLNPDL